jgi:predicted  nucleic acid-binding Zn-ribbon protein
MEITISFNEVNVALEIIKGILTDMREGRVEKNAAAESDLLAIVSELSETFKTIVGVVHPIRTLPNKAKDFPQAFEHFYDHFKLFYDATSFEEERAHCHNISRIHKRLSPTLSRLRNSRKAEELDDLLRALSTTDFDIIDQLRPLMDEVNGEVEKMKSLVDQDKFDEAIATKNQFVSGLSNQYNQWKATLEEMSDTIAAVIRTY